MSTFAHFILLIVAQWLASAINKTVAKVSNVFQISAQDWLKKCYNNLNLINNVYLCNKSEWNDDYSNRGTPLPIPNREVKPIHANGTVMKCGRVGSCHYQNGQVTPLKVCPVAFGYKKKESYDAEEIRIVVDWIEDSVYFEESTIRADSHTRFTLCTSWFSKLVRYSKYISPNWGLYKSYGSIFRCWANEGGSFQKCRAQIMNPNWGGEDASSVLFLLAKRKTIDAAKIINLP